MATRNKVPSVSQITGQLDKPALVGWAANSTRDYILSKLDGMETLAEKERIWIPLTTLIPIVNDAAKNYRSISATAINIGKEVHAAIQAYLTRGTGVTIGAQAAGAFKTFTGWMEDCSVESVAVEKTFETPQYKGRLDWLCRIEGKLYVVDFKVAAGVYPENRYQVAAYRNSDPDIEGSAILLLSRDSGMPEFIDTEDTFESDLNIFNALLNLWIARQ